MSQMEKVKTRLQTLPDKLTHSAQVPVGVHTPGTPPLLLLNGQLKHSNEILVLLGDNWFVQRTAKQSIDILERRISKTKRMIDDFKKEKANHEKWIGTVQQMKEEGDTMVDLQEEFDEEAEKRWREHHRERVRAEKVREREEKLRSVCSDDGELVSRMRQLELQEEEEEGREAGAEPAAFTGVVSERPAAQPTAPSLLTHHHSAPDPTTDPANTRVSKFAAARKLRK